MGIFRQFPYTNFHEMNLDWVINTVKQLEVEWERTRDEWATYKEFIDNYFENLDVSQEVLDALRIFASDGTLNEIIDPVIANAVTEWLNEHVTPTTPIIDSSLTIDGAGADAKTVGEIFKKTLNRKKVPQEAVNEHLLSYITETGFYIADVAYGGWTDSPSGVDGVLYVSHYVTNYMLQVYWEYGTPHNMYYRVVNINTHADYISWTKGSDIDRLASYGIGYKTLNSDIIETHLISHIIDAGVYDIDLSLGWTDAPNTYNGTLINSRYGSNYNIQIFFEFTAPVGMNNVYYRIVNRNTFTLYRDWTTFNTDLHIRFDPINDAYLTNNNITDFTQLPVNTVMAIDISAENYTAINLPYPKPGTLINVRPYTTKNPNYNFSIWLYITNTPASDNNQMFISFGHGSVHTAWSSINVNNGSGNIYPFASSVINKEPIVFIGDSIIAGLGGTGYDISSEGGGEFLMQYNGVDRYENIRGHCWVNSMIDYLNTIYEHTNVKNHGIGGITVNALRNNFDTLVPTGTKMVIISVGTNNYNNPSAILTDLAYIIRRCNERNIKFNILTNTPNNTTNKNLYTRIKGYITATCNTHGVEVLDMYSEFENYITLKNIPISDVLNSDGIHLNDTGYDIMFEIAKKLLHI